MVLGVPWKSILIVDDDWRIADLLTELFRQDGHEVHAAAHGALALDKLRQQSYDVIVCDIKMPVLDGPGLYWEVARRFPALRRRFIFITGFASDPETQTFLQETGAPVVSKPFRLDELRRLLERVLRPA
jgi:CheY-like chemotaxis protein